MTHDDDQFKREHAIQQNALTELSDEIMSALHARQLKEPSVAAETVTQWLREFYDIAQVGLGKSRHFQRGNN